MTGAIDDWPFDHGPNVASITVRSALEGAPILYVTHHEDGGWQFLDGEQHELDDAAAIGMGRALRVDATLREIADLLMSWVATGSEPGGQWHREPHPEPFRTASPTFSA